MTRLAAGSRPAVHSAKVEDVRRTLQALVDSPSGLLILHGPIGSGKKSTLAHVCRELQLSLDSIDAEDVWDYCMSDSHPTDNYSAAHEQFIMRLAMEATILANTYSIDAAADSKKACVVLEIKNLVQVLTSSFESFLPLLPGAFLNFYKGPPAVFCCITTIEEQDSKRARMVDEWVKSTPNRVIVFRPLAPTLLAKSIETSILAKYPSRVKISKAYVQSIADAAHGDLRYALNLIDCIPEKYADQLAFHKVERKNLFNTVGRAFYDKRIDLIPTNERGEFNRLRDEFCRFETETRPKLTFISNVWKLRFGFTLDIWDPVHSLLNINSPLGFVPGALVRTRAVTPNTSSSRSCDSKSILIVPLEEEPEPSALAADLDDIDEPPVKRRKYSTDAGFSDGEVPKTRIQNNPSNFVSEGVVLRVPEIEVTSAKIKSLAKAAMDDRKKKIKMDNRLSPDKEALQTKQIHGFYRLPAAENMEKLVGTLSIGTSKELPGITATACLKRLKLEDATLALAELCLLHQIESLAWALHEDVYPWLAIKLVNARNIHGCRSVGGVKDNTDMQFEKCRYKEAEQHKKDNHRLIRQFQAEMALNQPASRIATRKLMSEIMSLEKYDRLAWRKGDWLRQELGNLVRYYYVDAEQENDSFSEIED